MADATGVLSQAAMKKDRGLYGGGPAIAFPQVPGGSDLAAGHQIPFTQEGLVQSLNRSFDPNLQGSHAVNPAPLVGKPTGGPMSGRLRYVGMQRLLMLALGFESPNGDDGSPMAVGTGEGTKTVTNATNATPIVVSVATHGYSDGDGVQIVGVTGNTAANGDWRIDNKTAGTFELVDSSGNGAYGGSPTAEKFNAWSHIFEGDNTIQDEAWGGTDGRNAGYSANDRKVRRFQLGFDKQVSDWVYNSCFINKLTISGNPNEVTVTVDLVAYDQYRGSYNSASWTLPTETEVQSLFQSLDFKLGSDAVAPVSSYGINSFELSIDNRLKVDDQTTSSGTQFAIPVRDHFRDVMLKVEFPRYNATTWDTFVDIDGNLAASMIFTGPTIGATGETYILGFFLPSMEFINAPANIPGPGRIPQSLEFKAVNPTVANIFRTAHYNGTVLQKNSNIEIKVQNEEPINYLTEY